MFRLLAAAQVYGLLKLLLCVGIDIMVIGSSLLLVKVIIELHIACIIIPEMYS